MPRTTPVPRTARLAPRLPTPRAEPLEPRQLLSSTLTGIVFDDRTYNGLTPDDLPLPGQTIELVHNQYPDTSVERTTLTDADGRYTFADVPDGAWLVRRVPEPGRYGVESFPLLVPLTNPADTFDFSTYRRGTISGVVFDDVDHDGVRDLGESPLAGRTVFIDFDHDGSTRDDPSVTTGPDGSYAFEFGPETYRVRAANSGSELISPLFRDITLTSGAEVRGIDFGVAPVPAVSGLTLVNAASDRPIAPLAPGMTIDLAEVGRRLNVRADLAPFTRPADVRSVRFNLDGKPDARVENAAPYALAGDTAGDYASWTPRVGTHTLVVTPYGSRSGAGEPGRPFAINFTVIDTAAPAGTALRVNAGGSAFTTDSGDTYAADRGFRGALTRDKPFPVAGTDDDGLYSSMRLGRRMQFSAPVANGAYTLRLHFAEPTYARAGRRVFDVYAEDRRLLHDYDVFAAAGLRSADVEQFPVTVADGRLDLLFAASRDLALVSAIELTPAAQVPAVPAPFFVDAGAPAPTTDSDGRVFDEDRTGRYGFSGGTTSADVFDVGGFDPFGAGSYPLPDSALWATYHAGSAFSFSRPVANGHYAVFLGFAEPVEGAAVGSRVFDVSAEGRPVLDDYDVVNDATAARRQTVREFDVTVADGSLDLRFQGVVGDAVVSYIAAMPTDVPPAALPYAPEASTDAARLAAAASNLGNVGFAIEMYANEFKGRLPPGLKTLPGVAADDARIFTDPRAGTRLPRGATSDAEERAFGASHEDFVYLGAGKRVFNIDPQAPLVYENPRRVPGAIHVLFGDMHLELLGRAEAAALIGFDPAPPAQPPAFPPAPAADPAVVASGANLHALGVAIADFARYRHGRFPADFGVVYEVEDVPLPTFVNPRGDTTIPPGMTEAQKTAWAARSTDYQMLGGRFYIPNDLPIAWENPAEMKSGINLLFPDGRVEFREMRWAIESIESARAWQAQFS